MVGEQRRRTTGVNEQNRALIAEASLGDAVDQTGHRFAGVYRINSTPSLLRQQLHTAMPSSFGMPYCGAK